MSQKPTFNWYPINAGPGLRVTGGEVAGAELAPGLWLRRGPSGFEVGLERTRQHGRRGRVPAALTAARAAVMGLPLEAAVVECAVAQLDAGTPFDDADKARLRLARERAQNARLLIAELGAADAA